MEIEIELPLAERDLQLLQIEQEIKNKKNLLIKKYKSLNGNIKLNHYLENVKSDYTKYYDYIVKEKQQQHDALLLLKEYIDELMKTDSLVSEQIRIAKHDQKDIMEEISKVKGELDELIK